MKYRTFVSAAALVLCALLSPGCTSSKTGEPFDSPRAAVDSLVAALRAHDTPRLRQIFGPHGDEIVSSGDPIEDRNQADRFLAAYDQRQRLNNESDGSVTLLVGPDEWPFPVPIVPIGRKYAFDAEAGEDEILTRRIGRNELSTEQVCLAIADAQREYAETRPMGGELREYAQKLLSDPGKKNGLSWPTEEGEPPSPLGPLVATASGQGYGGTARGADEKPRPYHGYYYRLLTSQGPHAPGGPADYMVDGRLLGGFGVIASPAEYGNSGVMTFMTNHDGVLYERDFGPDTAKLVERITSFDPGPEWKRVSPSATSAPEPATP